MDFHRPPAIVRSFERLFSLSAEEREHLDRITCAGEEIEPRRKLIVEGKPCRSLHLLTSGWLVESKQLRDGTRQILNLRLPGDVVGIECLAYKNALHSTAALTPCTVTTLSFEQFQEIQRDFPRLAAALFLMTLLEGAILHEWEVNLGRRAAFPRVAHFLLELDRRLHLRGLGIGAAVPFPLTQQEIADCVGLTTPYVNRILQQMRAKGMIELENRLLTIREPALLAKAAGFKPDYIDHWGEGWFGQVLNEPQPD